VASFIFYFWSVLSVTLSIYLYIIMCVLVHYYPSTSERAFYKYLTIYQPLFRAFADHTIWWTLFLLSNIYRWRFDFYITSLRFITKVYGIIVSRINEETRRKVTHTLGTIIHIYILAAQALFVMCSLKYCYT